jgi:hypothetical protein
LFRPHPQDPSGYELIAELSAPLLMISTIGWQAYFRKLRTDSSSVLNSSRHSELIYSTAERRGLSFGRGSFFIRNFCLNTSAIGMDAIPILNNA